VWTDFLDGKLELCVSNEILSEYVEIISAKTESAFAEAIVNTLINKPNLIRVVPTWRFGLIEADPDDNKFVDCAIAANAKFIVTEDHHFDVLKDIPFPHVDVVSVDDFLKEVKLGCS
jgi:putative PIN family toxin of toxin-antitoxin system